MSKLLEVFGKAISVSTSEVIWYWANAKIGNCKDINDGLEKDENQSLVSILEMLSNTDLVNASEYLTHYIAQNQHDMVARLLRISILILENNISTAIRELEEVLILEPNNTMALYSLGYCHERKGDLDLATDYYQDCIKFKSYLQLPIQRLTAISLRKGNLGRGIELYRQLTNEYPDDVESLVLLGYLQLANLEYEEAVETFNTAILIHPDNLQSDTEHDDIQTMIEAGEIDAALEQVEFLLEEVGDLPDIYIKLGDVYMAAGDSAQAVNSYEKALRLQPNYMEANIKLGTLHLNNLHYSLAAEAFNRAVELNDEVVDAYIGLSCSYILCGNNRHALETISLAGALQENGSLLFAETASLNYQSAIGEGFVDLSFNTPEGVQEAVIDAHRKQSETSQNGVDSYYKLAVLLMAYKRYKEAIPSLQKAIEINRTHHRSRAKLAICYYETGKHSEAIDILVEPDILDNEILNLHYKTAVLFSDKQKFVSAVGSLEKFIKTNYSGTDAMESIQVVLENLALVDRASTSWERLCYTTYKALKK